MAGRRKRPNSLQVAFWNANGLFHKRLELQEFAERHGVDAILVNETHLRAAVDPKIANYILYRSDRQDRRGGGTAIYVKRTVEHHAVNVGELEHAEATAIEIVAGFGTIRLVAVYNPPNRALLESDMDTLLATTTPTVIAGDLNAKHPNWNSRRVNLNGKILQAYSTAKGTLVDGPVDPTHYSPIGTPDVLDIAIFKEITVQYALTSLNDLSSDHNPVLMTLGNAVRDPEFAERRIICWPAFTDHLEQNLQKIQFFRTKTQLDDAVVTFTTTIQNSLNNASRVEREITRQDRLPEEINQLITAKNRARKRYQRSWNPVDREQYNRLAVQVNEALRSRRSEQWDAKLESLEENSNSDLWRVAKAIRNKNSPMPPIHGASGIVYTEAEKADVFAENLERQCSPNFDNADLDHIERVEADVRARLASADANRHLLPASPEEVKQLINRTRERKAPGPDGITNKVLKSLSKKAIMTLVAIINAILRLRYFPHDWKCADVIVLPKPGQSATFPQNYRPISLLPTLGKIAEGVILKRLRTEVENLGATADEQFGFRARHSTTQQILRVVEFAAEGFNKKQSTGVIFLDVSKAFDKVWHTGLLFKMLEAGIHTGLVKLIESFLRERRFRVKLRDSRSGERTMEAGVPQGSLLSPELFKIYTRDLPKTAGTNLALFADDTAVAARSLAPHIITRRLQEAADELEEWFATWRIQVNANKSAAMFFSKRRREPDREITIFGQPIPWKNETKYLGVTLDRKLTWKAHTDSCLNKGNMAAAHLYPLLNRRSKLSAKTKLRLYKVIIRPIMTYASAVWGYAAKSHIHKLQVVQNRIIRMAFDAPWFMRNDQLHREAGLVTIEVFIKEAAAKFFTNATTHPNALVRDVVAYDENMPMRHKRPKLILADT